MCGRYTLATSPDELASRFGVAFDRSVAPRYNCAPGQRLPVVTTDADSADLCKWGLIPRWADDRSTSFINARAETVREKRSFADAYESRRCLVPADGFYEWVDDGDDRQPYRVALEGDRPFAMAGIRERWTPSTRQATLGGFDGDDGPDGEPDPIETFAVLTTEPNDLIADLHHRMAVVLAPDEEERWLRGSPDEAATLLDPYPADEMYAHPVSSRVNDPGVDDPSLIRDVSG